ncbi:ATP-binding protein [Paenibacillus sp. SAF-054]|uniref:ATP-binding protein n=1 Tax=Paenibacillus sp. SAF-054 TaxID=3436863 RepID=UPI003F7F0AFB
MPLRDHFKRLDPAFQHAAIGMALISLHGTFLQINSAFCDLLGHPRHELHSISHLDDAYSDVLTAIKEFGQTLRSGQLLSGTLEQPMQHLAGRLLQIKIHLHLILQEDGDPLHYLAQFEDRTPWMDIESRIRATETLLQDTQHSYHQLLEKMPLAVLITKKGIIQYVNPAGLRLIHAKDSSEVIGIPTSDVVDNSYHVALSERRKKFAESQALPTITYLINSLDGQQKFVDGFTLIISYEGEPAAVGVFKDITEQRQKEEYMMQSEKLTMAGQLAAGIAHEIRNPLTSINGFMKLMRSSKQSSETYYDIIESELKRIELIVNELLALSKPQGQHHSKPIDILPVLDQVITLMRVQSALKNIEIELERPESSLWIIGETNQLKQVFINLLKNGMDAMDAAGTIRVSARSGDQEALINVKDEGRGMTAEQIERLGEPFFTTKDTGTGLGFMITQNIIHNHGGSIQVESVPDQGTTFTVKLPMTPSPEEVQA